MNKYADFYSYFFQQDASFTLCYIFIPNLWEFSGICSENACPNTAKILQSPIQEVDTLLTNTVCNISVPADISNTHPQYMQWVFLTQPPGILIAHLLSVNTTPVGG